ncbi:hypothetical protein BCF46_1151 [Litoreibacter meonggei]|uniref:Uncharacterized protein n=1 Tax=Litoreibacter meonggei TaxID=1049199 RepID=A0A497X318_9RHOB|nr:hypothetical protein [Litoreibacter meonggei]RLJ59009.1 hypothetical protein BCF46_1151 [Litoreibacter meonggei]
MAPLIGMLIGALLGAALAKRKGGNRLDMAQYAGGFAIIFGLIGLFVAIYLARAAVAA